MKKLKKTQPIKQQPILKAVLPQSASTWTVADFSKALTKELAKYGLSAKQEKMDSQPTKTFTTILRPVKRKKSAEKHLAGKSKEEISNKMRNISFGKKFAEHLQKSGQIPKDHE